MAIDEVDSYELASFLRITLLKKHIALGPAKQSSEISMKRTPEDQQFGEKFARMLRPLYERAISAGQTERAFAQRLGVDRGGLQRYLKKHATPSLRTLVFAYREFGIVVPYGSASTEPLVSRRGRSKRQVSDLQMNLPLTIEAPDGEINLVIKKKSAQRYRLELNVRKRG
jgi:transcriptional regulator with XRE-family HTH domain